MRPDAALDPDGIASWDAVERLRLQAYGLCLALAFALYLIVHGQGQGAIYWAATLSCAAGIALGMIALGLQPARSCWPLRWGSVGAAGIATLVPIAPALMTGLPMAAAVQGALWRSSSSVRYRTYRDRADGGSRGHRGDRGHPPAISGLVACRRPARAMPDRVALVRRSNLLLWRVLRRTCVHFDEERAGSRAGELRR